MSKDLEREYRVLLNSEVPDLWARIEAGLEEKKTADLHVMNSQTTSVSMKRKQRKRTAFKVWAGLVAASVCVALIIPAMTRTMRMGGSSCSDSGSMTSDHAPAPPEAYDSTDKAGEKAEAAYENEMDNLAAADGASLNSMGTSNDMSAADVQAYIEGAAALEEAEAGEVYSFHATVEILGIDVRRDSGILYTAKVIAAEDPGLEVDGEIRIFSPAVPEKGVTALEDSQVYDIVLYEDQSDSLEQEMTYILAGVGDE